MATKKRKATATRKPARRTTAAPRKRQPTAAEARVHNDMWGYTCIGIGAVAAFALWAPEDGAVVGAVSQGLGYLIGRVGLWAVMVISLLLGLALLTGERPHLRAFRITGAWLLGSAALGLAALLAGDLPEAQQLARVGHYGQAVGALVDMGFGMGAGGVLLVLLALLGFTMAFGVTLRDVAAHLGELLPQPVPGSDEEDEPKPAKKPAAALPEPVTAKVITGPEIIDVPTIRKVEPTRALPIAEAPATGGGKDKPAKKEHIPGSSVPTVAEGEYPLPPVSILVAPGASVQVDEKYLREKSEVVKEKLAQFNIAVTMRDIYVGPTVTQFTLEPNEGIKLSRITALEQDLALALKAKAVRIEAPIPGKGLVGIEIPNDNRQMVMLRELLESDAFAKAQTKGGLVVALGKDVSGQPIVEDLIKMPHLLIAGATGSGKSVATNTMLLSLLFHHSPRDLRLIMVDPKQVELAPYNGIPHLLSEVITDPDSALKALRWAVREMTRRYRLAREVGARNLDEYNSKVEEDDRLPRIVILIDELADLMMSGLRKETETNIARLTQMARAMGMHVIVATQRPSVDVITGLIKANIPTRIAFTVASGIDSRTILDTTGAENLLGLGDMLYMGPGSMSAVRLQGPYVGGKEVEEVIKHIRIHSPAPELTDFEAEDTVQPGPGGIDFDAEPEDDMFFEALKAMRGHKGASASLLQRKLSIGYARAARLLDDMEKAGIIGPVNGAKPREIIADIEAILTERGEA